MGGCCGEGIPGCERVFDRRTAEADLRDLRAGRSPWATRTLVDALAAGLGLDGLTVLDIGAGVGAVHLELLARGASSAVDIDGSSAYLELAGEEAARRGVDGQVSHRLGDLIAVHDDLAPADLVALDRVICCDGRLDALLGAAAGLARRRLGLVYPRDDWWARWAVRLSNPVVFRGSSGYRMHVHRIAAVHALLGDAGLAPLSERRGRLWRVECWERTNVTGARAAPS